MGYAWGQEGVSNALVGHFGMGPLKENIQNALKFKEDGIALLNREEQESRLAEYAGPHALCWARPGYVDGTWA